MQSVLAAAWCGGKPAAAGRPGLAWRAPLCFIESDGTPSWQRGAGGDILLLAEGSRGRYSPPGRGVQGDIFSSCQKGAGGDTLQHNQVRIFTVKAWSISVRPSISFMNLDFVVRIPSPAPPPPGRLTPPPRPPAAAAAPPAAARATRGTQKQVSGCPQTGGRQHRNIA